MSDPIRQRIGATVALVTLSLTTLAAQVTHAGPLLAQVVSETDSTSVLAVRNPHLTTKAGTHPSCFTANAVGVNTGSQAYTSRARSGARAWKVTISRYRSGDRGLTIARSSCAPAVAAGHRYRLTTHYTGTAKARLFLFLKTHGEWHRYAGTTVRSDNTWKTLDYVTPALPSGATRLAFGLHATGRGTLITDDYAIGDVTPAPDGEPAVGGDPSEYALYVYDGQVMRWNPCETVTYRVNPGLVPDQPAFVADVKSALAAVAKASGLRFDYRGTTDFVPTTSNGGSQPAALVIAASDHASTDYLGAGAVGTGGWSATGVSNGSGFVYKISSGRVVVDTDYSPVMTGAHGPTGRDVLLEHEIGHAVGLDHTTGYEVMYPSLRQDGAPGYQAGDLAGLAKVGATNGCIGAAAPGSAVRTYASDGS